MYPDLSYLFHDLIGTPIDNWLSIFKTFGLLLVLASFFRQYHIVSGVKAQGREGHIPPVKVQFEYSKPAGTGRTDLQCPLGFVFRL